LFFAIRFWDIRHATFCIWNADPVDRLFKGSNNIFAGVLTRVPQKYGDDPGVFGCRGRVGVCADARAEAGSNCGRNGVRVVNSSIGLLKLVGNANLEQV
jgi:hypothetical protein